ncbi:hypothetical protein ACNPQM_28215 [Streptomyces sp. NPDC056231]|uniref:hypothetical protein n=1 Tax=Streptomyces sp. NPDC056231 TaxID=3345755 RepID=UPI003AAFC0FA
MATGERDAPPLPIEPCVRCTGNRTGVEPAETGSGPRGTYCRCTASDITYD